MYTNFVPVFSEVQNKARFYLLFLDLIVCVLLKFQQFLLRFNESQD